MQTAFLRAGVKNGDYYNIADFTTAAGYATSGSVPEISADQGDSPYCTAWRSKPQDMSVCYDELDVDIDWGMWAFQRASYSPITFDAVGKAAAQA